jgi:hypothetical protein
MPFDASLLCTLGVFDVLLCVHGVFNASCCVLLVLLVFFNAYLLCAFGAFSWLLAMCFGYFLTPPCCMFLLFFVD